jgi:adenine-specific DNA-methyltransferase
MAEDTISKKGTAQKRVKTLTHEEATRKNIPTAEYQSVLAKNEQNPVRVTYERRNRDLDPQLVWRGKDEQDWSDLVVQSPPLYIQEKVHPKVLIDDLLRRTKAEDQADEPQPDLFADFNGLPDEQAKTEFYRHDANWSNRMILGDSLQVMASLAEREGLRGKVQCIYLDPPYGIKFNSNFQWSTTSRDVKDGNTEHITREPEQVKAFRDTWRDGIHSYLNYLRDRLTAARDLLADSGSIFVQIGDENIHRVRSIMDEVLGSENFCGQIFFKKTSGAGSPGELTTVAAVGDYLLWYAKSFDNKKFRPALVEKSFGGEGADAYRLIRDESGTINPITKVKSNHLTESELSRVCRIDNITSQSGVDKTRYPVRIEGEVFTPNKGVWKTGEEGMARLLKALRVSKGKSAIGYVRLLSDFAAIRINNSWDDTTISGASNKVYVVQTSEKVVQRCVLMTTDPGDLVLDPTCGSGTTAYVAEQWGRRWITIDTSRVALALARARIMGGRYPYYLLADSPEGQRKEAEVTRAVPSSSATHGDIRQGFVYERVPHITLKSIANNAEIDVIWEKWQAVLEPLREKLNIELKKEWQEWEIPRAAEDPWDEKTQELFYLVEAAQQEEEQNDSARIAEFLQTLNQRLKRNYNLKTLPQHPVDPWPEVPTQLHTDWWKARITRQKEIDASIAAKAEFEYLYDRPYEDKKTVRVAGPFTVESLSPHRVLAVDENDELIDPAIKPQARYGEEKDFVQMILENLKTAGVQQAHKEDRIAFTSLTPWPGDLICADGRYTEGNNESGKQKRAAIFVGPEFGTVSRPDLVAAAREAGDAGFDVLITCAFNYDAHSTEFNKLGRIPVLKARMNADLHMSDDLKNTGKGNLFVIFGEPDIEILDAGKDGNLGQIRVKVNGVDVFHPNTGEVRSDGPEGIACWFVDTNYNEESFFVRHAYFLGANDPYTSLKTTLKAEINQDAWATLHSDISRPFDRPTSGRIAVKVINHLGDEVMKVFRHE